MKVRDESYIIFFEGRRWFVEKRARRGILFFGPLPFSTPWLGPLSSPNKLLFLFK
jgi:hypothetical protein